MKIAFSPCPNDTFIFHAWVHHLIPNAPMLEVTYADIDRTNQLATTAHGPDILKISCAALPWVLSDYALLPCGGALGNGCGPLILAKNGTIFLNDPSKLVGRRVAIPSEQSTAYLLLRLWADLHIPGTMEIYTLPFHEIMGAVRDGIVDAGLVIHEARFTYPAYNLAPITDLGAWWEEETNLPLPLGAIIARRSLDIATITQCIQASIEYAWENPKASQEYILEHAQEMNPHVVQKHIQLYVNKFSYDLGKEGYLAISTLLDKASQAGLVPHMVTVN
jgi:1,4-dihydroxy-6-naphthoate synthase